MAQRTGRENSGDRALAERAVSYEEGAGAELLRRLIAAGDGLGEPGKSDPA